MEVLYVLGKRICDFLRFASDCTTGWHKSLPVTSADEKEDVVDSCSQMVLQLRDVYDPEKVRTSPLNVMVLAFFSFMFEIDISSLCFSSQIKVRLKIVSSSPGGVVVAEAKKIQSNWVILDK